MEIGLQIWGKRPNEDANNNAAMESNVAMSAFMFSKENFSKNLRNIQTMDAKYEEWRYWGNEPIQWGESVIWMTLCRICVEPWMTV